MMFKKNIYLYILIASICLIFIQCKKAGFGELNMTSGNADFSKYIAVGNSLTQGYQDEGLYEQTQKYSYPALIAKQLKMVDSDMEEFIQPIAPGNGSGYSHLEYIDGDLEVIRSSNSELGYGPDASWDAFDMHKGTSFNNLGIAGVRLRDCVGLDAAERNINYFVLNGLEALNIKNPFASFLDWGTATNPNEYIDHISIADHTLFTCWLGNNDVLGMATNGAVEVSYNLFGITIDAYKYTEVSKFREKYDKVLEVLTEDGAKGVCATIPNILTIPYFTTITPSMYNYDVWIETGNGEIRKALEGDIFMLSTRQAIEDKNGTSQSDPLGNEQVLDIAEVAEVTSYVLAYNQEIKASASAYDVGVVDMYAYFESFPNGITIDGITLSQTYIEGGAISLDGIHPNPRGSALIANEFIKALNDTYFSKIPLLSVGNYPGIVFPN